MDAVHNNRIHIVRLLLHAGSPTSFTSVTHLALIDTVRCGFTVLPLDVCGCTCFFTGHKRSSLVSDLRYMQNEGKATSLIKLCQSREMAQEFAQGLLSYAQHCLFLARTPIR